MGTSTNTRRCTWPKSANLLVAAWKLPGHSTAWQLQLGGAELLCPTYGTDLACISGPPHPSRTVSRRLAALNMIGAWLPTPPQIEWWDCSPKARRATSVSVGAASPTPPGQMTKDKLLPLPSQTPPFQSWTHTYQKLLGFCGSLGMLSIKAGFDWK